MSLKRGPIFVGGGYGCDVARYEEANPSECRIKFDIDRGCLGYNGHITDTDYGGRIHFDDYVAVLPFQLNVVCPVVAGSGHGVGECLNSAYVYQVYAFNLDIQSSSECIDVRRNAAVHDEIVNV